MSNKDLFGNETANGTKPVLSAGTGNLLELFAGSRSIGKVGDELGMNVFSVDWQNFDGINLAIDIGEMKTSDVPFVPDVVWASPDCTTYSIAACSTHRTNSIEPKTEYAKKCDQVNKHFIGLIKEWLKVNPDMVFFIENPRGMLRKMPFMQEFIEDTNGVRQTVWYCFSGETKYLTDNGYKSFLETVNTKQKVLNKNGEWVVGKVNNYGKQPIVNLKLRRGGVEKVIRTTFNHKWFYKKRHQKEYKIIETNKLQSGFRLKYNSSSFDFNSFEITPEYFCRGFVVGDGYVVEPKDKLIRNGYSVSMVYGEKNRGNINKYFEGFGHKSFSTTKNGLECTITTGLPYHWKKEMPCLKTTKHSDLLSWLMGYFAADGSVSKNASQSTITSANRGDLEYVVDLCAVIGIGCYEIQESFRKGFNDKYSYLYSLTIMRNSLNPEFFVNQKHKNNFKSSKGSQPLDWIVEDIEYTNDIEDVFCVEVPDGSSFTLEGGILTHNCQYGDDRAKPTDIWTNSNDWKPRPQCKNGNPNCHHQPAPRGSKTGTQGRKGSYERSIIPRELCLEVLISACR